MCTHGYLIITIVRTKLYCSALADVLVKGFFGEADVPLFYLNQPIHMIPSEHLLQCDALYCHTQEQAEKLREKLYEAEKTMANIMLMKHGRTHVNYPDRVFYIAESFNPFDNNQTLKYSKWNDLAARCTSDIPVSEWDKLSPIPLYETPKHCEICGVSEDKHKPWIGYSDSVLDDPKEYTDHKGVYLLIKNG